MRKIVFAVFLGLSLLPAMAQAKKAEPPSWMNFGFIAPYVFIEGSEKGTGIIDNMTKYVLKGALGIDDQKFLNLPVARWAKEMASPESQKCSIPSWRFKDSSDGKVFRLYSRPVASWVPFVGVGKLSHQKKSPSGLRNISLFDLPKLLKVKSGQPVRIGLVNRPHLDLDHTLAALEKDKRFKVMLISGEKGYLNVHRMLLSGRIDFAIA